jgi:inner membrane transporter RhtA
MGKLPTRRHWLKTYPLVLSIASLVAAMICFQVGAALAKTLFPLVGAAGATALRLGLGTVILAAVWRPWRLRVKRVEARAIVLYGLAMGSMNLLFYSSLETIPLGIAVALEFTGPLAVAMAASRRAVDFVWIALACLGLAMLLPLTKASNSLATAGVAYALGAGVCWGLYILFGRAAGGTHGGRSAALGMAVGAALVVPIGAAKAGLRLLAPSLLPAAIGVAVLSSALPYSLEMIALRRLPTRSFGVLMSLAPAVGALSGFLFLGERLAPVQWAAIASIMVASGGSAATSGPTGGQPPSKESFKSA